MHTFLPMKKQFLEIGLKDWRFLLMKKFTQVGNPELPGLIWNSIKMANDILLISNPGLIGGIKVKLTK